MASSSPLLRPLAHSATKSGRPDGRVLLLVLFGVYLLLLTWIVVWKLELPHVGNGAFRPVKLVPFVATAEAGASDPAEVVANIALFVPFGIYLGLLVRRWSTAAATFAAASIAFEAAQYVLAVGSADTTDVLANTAGGLAGIGLVALARRRLSGRTAAVLKRVCATGTVVAVLMVGIFVASPVSFTQPDVRMDPSRVSSAG